MENIFLDLYALDKDERKELEDYRALGSIKYFKRLRRRDARRLNIIGELKSALIGASTTFSLWLFLSWLDIVLHNTRPDPVYQAWNFFALFF